MFYVAASDRLHTQSIRSDPGRFRESDSLHGSIQELSNQFTRDADGSSSLLLNHSSYVPAYAPQDQYFSASNPNSRGQVPRSRVYLDQNNSQVVHGSFPSIGHQAHHRYPDALQHSASTDDLSYSSQLGPPIMPTLPHLSREDSTGNLDITNLLSNYSPEPGSTMTASPSTHSSPGSTGAWKMPAEKSAAEPVQRPRKARREKPRIELAPDQPPTTQGKPRARVYVACIQCRTRKIRCDGAKPVCHNCGRRSNGNGECTYDAAPKRRGPDKTPGARQRMARDVRNEIEGSIGSPRRQRRRRDDDIKSEVHSLLPSGSLSDPSRYGGQQVPSSWPLCLSPISSISTDTFRSAQDYLPVQSSMHHNSKLPHNNAECGCPVSSGYHNEFPERTDSVYIPRGMPQVQDYDSYVQGYDTTPNSYVNVVSNGYVNITEDDYEGESEKSLHIVSEPSGNFTRKVWWDSLLGLYNSMSCHYIAPLNSTQRENVSRSITDDLRFLFKSSNYWFSFFHVPTFFSNFFDPDKRELMQPSLILAALSIATFWQSSELGAGKAGREKALRFRDEAQAALENSFNANWVDETLAQAAWLLALFEVCAHPLHSTQRSTSAMIMLDSIIRSLSLTCLDMGNRTVSVFAARAPPIVHSSSIEPTPSTSSPVPWSTSTATPAGPSRAQRQLSHITATASSCHSPTQSPPSRSAVRPDSGATPANQHSRGCSCKSLSLAEHRPRYLEHTPLWAASPAWDKSWTEADIRKESCRRLCWSSMILAAGHISYATANKNMGLDLFVSDPSNYALLFTGEATARSVSGTHSSKDTVWALYDRAVLLWHSCVRMRHDRIATDVEKARFALTSWLEADEIETKLNRHTCGLERAFIFVGREYLFNTRMCISHEFQRFIPLVNADVNGLFHRKKAQEWLNHQITVTGRFMDGLHTVTGLSNNLLARRPFFVFWFMGQVSRSLSLWDCDHSLTVALDVCRAFLAPIEYLTALWPCGEQRKRYEALRERLASACFVAGQPPLNPPNLTSPAHSSSAAAII